MGGHQMARVYGNSMIFMDTLNLTQKHLDILGKIFVAEISDKLPYQSKSRLLIELEREGLVEFYIDKFPGHFAVEVRGWALTHRGRLFYCEPLS